MQKIDADRFQARLTKVIEAGYDGPPVADTFLAKAMEAGYGRPPTYEEGIDPVSMLPWGDSPGPRDNVLLCHPDRPDEAVVWRHFVFHGKWACGTNIEVKKSFVEECLAGNINAVDNPRQWLWHELVMTFLTDCIVI